VLVVAEKIADRAHGAGRIVSGHAVGELDADGVGQFHAGNGIARPRSIRRARGTLAIVTAHP
jgi:hypothetical protein